MLLVYVTRPLVLGPDLPVDSDGDTHGVEMIDPRLCDIYAISQFILALQKRGIRLA